LRSTLNDTGCNRRKTGLNGTCPLLAGAGWPERPYLHDSEVPIHAYGRGEGRSGMGERNRSARYEGGPADQEDASGRIAPVDKRDSGRDEPDRAEAGKTGVCRGAATADPVLRTAAPGQTRSDRLGPGSIPLRELGRGRAGKAEI